MEGAHGIHGRHGNFRRSEKAETDSARRRDYVLGGGAKGERGRLEAGGGWIWTGGRKRKIKKNEKEGAEGAWAWIANKFAPTGDTGRAAPTQATVAQKLRELVAGDGGEHSGRSVSIRR